ncbi:3-deoxy-manno-octulosonate cytidylyltransferase [Arenicella chitinivorans]|uniref:3-deoxy-manno-octulosonate cytidylyltransferase n=1 Tax=Arenicella chitinivorans TaxID=1329800 RepID=A0A918S095_9GAMM|nr:3-deoxy-manno-octulosonate cytidylyltransferase [Arenicella chitinivorans]GHA15529.1 3-deoxy-manno-octulosonate cytidylyltransferase [Arenicella chitinivorans]
MTFSVVIPARYASTRLPGKALADIGGKPMIQHVVDRANQSAASRVIVATDDSRIAAVLRDADCEVCMTRADHVSGSDRLAEVVTLLGLSDDEVVVNVQGDEPLIPSRLIDQVADSLTQAEHAVMSTAAKAIEDDADIFNPNVVKVVFARDGQAMYFSRAPIPFARDQRTTSAWHHIGIYAYRAGYLRRYPDLPASVIETTESLEQLRVLDNGDAIMVEQVDYFTGIGVDTPQDLERVRSMLEASQQGGE